MQSIDSIEIYAYGKSKDLVSRKEVKMINFQCFVKENIKKSKLATKSRLST